MEVDSSLTREDAERICKAHGWTLDCRDRPIEEGYWPLVRGWAEGTDEPICLPPAILAALDLDRPPSLAALQRLALGAGRMNDASPIAKALGDLMCVHGLDAMLARAWALGSD